MTDTIAPSASDVVAAAPALTWSAEGLRRRGQEHRILSGAVHYFRVHPDLWEDRLRRLVAMGANTVDTYVAWNFHERTEGDIRFDGWRDLERFIRLAGDLGLDVFVRPSPYICAEWSNGGIPFWLSGRARALRTSDEGFLAAVEAWYDELIPRLVPLQAAFGGPIVAIQVENEYGSFGSDADYLAHQREALRSRGIVEMLTTADGITPDMIEHGSVDGAMATFTFGTGVRRALELRRAGDAFMCAELWGGWFDHWGEHHHVRSAASARETLDELLSAGGSVSLYMAHGGTNFGLWNGANHDGVLQPTVTSYDSDAPIGEDGTLGEKFDAVRAAFAPFHTGELPPPPAPPRFQRPQRAELVRRASLLEVVRAAAVVADDPRPLTFEELGAEDGLVAYENGIRFGPGATLRIEGLHDRATVFLGEERLGTLARDGATTLALPPQGGSGTLTIVVESLGRINYGPLLGEGKGIMSGVLIDRRYVHGWAHRVIPQDAPVVAGAGSAPDGLAVATFDVGDPADAWLAFPGGAKGMVWLNGFLLGRYWSVGPQATLYAPAPLWHAGRNEVRVLDTDALGQAVEICDRPRFGPTEEFIGS